MLAMGFYFADKTHRNVQQITTSGGESIFHREGRLMIWQDLEAPSIATMAALLILSDLELGRGNSILGMRLAGTHVTHSAVHIKLRGFAHLIHV